LIKAVLTGHSFADMEFKFTLPHINAEGSTQSVFLVKNLRFYILYYTKKNFLDVETRTIRLGSTY
jgi:hypothetical protein